MKKPIVSVILPTFNRARTLKRAISSVLNQSFKDFELIIIDDASKDNTFEIISRYSDKRIIYLKRNINSCIEKVNARNDGLKIARGKYIAYIDSDNDWLKQHLKVLYNFIESDKKLSVVYCDSWVWRNGVRNRERGYDFDKKKAVPFPFIDTGEIMHKKKCIKKSGMWKYDGYKHDDWEFFVRLSKYHNTKHLRKILCNYYCSNQLDNAMSFLKKAINNYRHNKRMSQISIQYLRYSIESCEKCPPKQKIRAKKIESAAKALFLFKDKNEVLNLL